MDPGQTLRPSMMETPGPIIEGIDRIVPFRVPLTTPFRGVQERHGLLLHGEQGWGEWSPFDEYDDDVARVWLDSALDSARVPAPLACRDRIPVSAIVPAVGPNEARRIVAESGCTTVKIKIAGHGEALAEGVARVAAVRAELGPFGRIRLDANAAWDIRTAVAALGALEEAAGGLEFIEQPCDSLEALAEVRDRTGIAVAADEAIRHDHADPTLLRDAVDIAVIKVQPSGGIHSALSLAEELGLPAVVSSALDTTVGLAAGARLAAALPDLPFACGLGSGLLLADDVTEQSLRPVDGELTLAEVHAVSLRGDVPSPPPTVTESLLTRLADVLRIQQSNDG